MPEETLIDRLKWIKEEHFRGKQGALAEAMRCGPPYVSALFKGARTNPSSELLDNLLSSLRNNGVNIRREWVLHGDGERYGAAKITPPMGDAGMSPRTQSDFEATTKWITSAWNDATLKQQIGRAVETGRSDIARVLLDILDQRNPVSSSSAEDDAASLDAEHDEATEEELLKSERKPGADAPTVRKPGRQPSV